MGSSNNTVYSVFDNELQQELALKEIIVNQMEQLDDVIREIQIQKEMYNSQN